MIPLLNVPTLFANLKDGPSSREENFTQISKTKYLVSWPSHRSLSPREARIILPHYDRKVFYKHVKTRLPKYEVHFQQAAKLHNLSWKVLASQAYQESHWNRRARSPTGVRGIMMLTRKTAASLGIKNRIDPVLSIYGGAKYLARLHGKIARSVHDSDRTFFALAAYNVGIGHLNDARILARRKKKNPNFWNDVREVLPLLKQKKYYTSLRYGFARGDEPVRYVKRIRAYHSLLDQTF